MCEGQGTESCTGCPIPTSAQCVFSLLGRVFGNLGLFGMLLALLPSCTLGQETPGFGWESCIPQPQPMAWPARAKMPPWERGTLSLSLFIILFFFIIFSALMFFSRDVGLGMGSPDPPFWGCCIPLEQIHVPQCLQGGWAELIITASLPLTAAIATATGF